ncbi:MAG: hypothetical protein ACJAZM_001026 [Cyclobacteriaceae bacterium]|jgi:hypothetical protein
MINILRENCHHSVIHILLFSFLFLLGSENLAAQTDSQTTTEITLKEGLARIKSTYNIAIYYQDEWINDVTVPSFKPSSSLRQALSELLLTTSLSFDILDDAMVILLNGSAKQILPEYTLSGQLIQEENETPIIGATVLLKQLSDGSSTDVNGNFSITAPMGNYQVVIKSVSTIDKVLDIDLTSDTTIFVRVFDKTVQLDGVVVTGQAIDKNVTSANAGKIVLDLESVKTLPAFMGEVDIAKVIQTLPGVSSIGEGTSGFNVRGGNIDQNLILFDNIPIFNSSHLLGFFSVFNPDVVGNFTLYKGSMPANYGGRLSSLLDVTQKIPDKEQVVFIGGIGPVNNRAQLEIPIISGKSSLMIGGRYANPALVLNSFDRQSIAQSSAAYGDLNLKYHHNISENDVISFSSYLSTDRFSFSGDTTYQYAVDGFSLAWNHKYNNNLTSNLVAFYSDYRAKLINDEPLSANTTGTGITNYGLTANFTYYFSDKLVVDAGVNLNMYNISPGSITPSGNSGIRDVEFGNELALETGTYVNAEYKLSPRVSMVGGLRYSTFSNIGSGDEPLFDPDLPRTESSITEIISYDPGSFVRTFGGLEPRFSLNVLLNQSTSFKASYSLNRQYIHLFSNATASLPTDVWKVSDRNVMPQIGHQYSAGFFKNWAGNMYETSAEVFYRDIAQLTELRTGAPVLMNEFLEKDLLAGEGRAYGLELYVKKQIGRVNGWVSYTLSRTERLVDSDFISETINQGNYYAADFDSPHNLNISSNIKLSRLWTASWNFVYQSGRPVTLPQSSFRYTVNNDRYYTYIDRNNFRIPDTHRLDLSVTLAGSNKRNSPWENSFTFSVYNVYGRDNPFSVFVNNIDANNSIPRVFQLAVLGSAFPSFTINFKYKGTKE